MADSLHPPDRGALRAAAEDALSGAGEERLTVERLAQLIQTGAASPQAAFEIAEQALTAVPPGQQLTPEELRACYDALTFAWGFAGAIEGLEGEPYKSAIAKLRPPASRKGTDRA